MTSDWPDLTALIKARVAIGLVGSMGIAFARDNHGFTHHCLAIVSSMAKTGLRSVSDKASPASRKLT